MVVQHNLLAINSNRMYGINCGLQSKVTEKLSSGYRVNRAADDAAGLAISEKMRRQIRGLTQASRNTQDGVSFCQIADGALNEVHDMLKRSQELAVQAANGTNTDEDRNYLNLEVLQLQKEIDNIHNNAVFNDIRVFSDSGIIPGTHGEVGDIKLASDGNYHVNIGSKEIIFEVVDVNGDKVSSPTSTVENGAENPQNIANSSLAQFAVKAASDAAYNLSRIYPTLFANASTDNIKIGLELSNQAVGGTLATANLSWSTLGDSSAMSYKMWVDTKDYPIDKFDSMTDAAKADLAAVIAHEMTHLVMYDTVSTGMLGNNLPTWFKEGAAQASSGDNGWVSYKIGPSSSDQDIKDYKAMLANMPYGAGYCGVMYLGYVAGGGTMPPTSGSDVTSSTIAGGLDKILTELSKGKTFDDAIKTATGGVFTSQSDFADKFTDSADANSLAFMKSFLAARGSNGGGSLFGNLNESEATTFSPGSLSDTYSSYALQTDHQWYSNMYGANMPIPTGLTSTGTYDDGEGIRIQTGTEKDTFVLIKQFNVSSTALFGNMMMDVSTIAGANETIDLVKDADARVSAVRSYYGAMQNRLEHKIANLDNVVENTTAAESRIRDTDMATEMVKYSNMNILLQAGQSLLAQANQQQQSVLSLIQ